MCCNAKKINKLNIFHPNFSFSLKVSNKCLSILGVILSLNALLLIGFTVYNGLKILLGDDTFDIS